MAESLEGFDLRPKKLQIARGLVEHGSRVHLGPAGDEPLQDPNPLADSLSPLTRRHSLRVRRDPNVLPPRPLHRLEPQVDRTKRRGSVYHLLHLRHRLRIRFLPRRRRCWIGSARCPREVYVRRRRGRRRSMLLSRVDRRRRRRKKGSFVWIRVRVRVRVC